MFRFVMLVQKVERFVGAQVLESPTGSQAELLAELNNAAIDVSDFLYIHMLNRIEKIYAE